MKPSTAVAESYATEMIHFKAVPVQPHLQHTVLCTVSLNKQIERCNIHMVNWDDKYDLVDAITVCWYP